MALIDITLGHETYLDPAQTVQITAGYRKEVDSEPDNITSAARDPLSGVRLRRSEFVQASNVNTAHGGWTEIQYETPDSCFIDLQVHRDDGGTRKWGMLVLAVHPGAGLNRLGVRLTGHTRAVRTWAYFSGRFDIIPADDLIDMDYSHPPLSELLDITEDTHNYKIENLEPGREYEGPQSLEPQTPPDQPVITTTGSKRRLVLRRGQI